MHDEVGPLVLGFDHRTGIVVPFQSATIWLSAMTESVARKCVNQLGISDIVSAKVTNFLEGESKSPSTDAPEPGFDGLVKDMTPRVTAGAADYGIGIDHIGIQNVTLSTDIQHAIDDTRKAARKRKPRTSLGQRQARFLGKDNVALNELLKNFRNSTLLGYPAFLQNLLGGLDSKASQAASQKISGSTDGDNGRGSLPASS